VKIGKTYFMVPVKEMAPAVAFYRSVFGLEPAYESGEWTELPHGERVSIALHRGEIAAQKMGLGFEVDDVDDILRRTEAAGGRIVEPLGRRIAIVADPDGNEISIMPVR